MLDRINNLKKNLNEVLEGGKLVDKKTLKLSQELDMLILNYYKNLYSKNAS